jgi:hypothetical protein
MSFTVLALLAGLGSLFVVFTPPPPERIEARRVAAVH